MYGKTREGCFSIGQGIKGNFTIKLFIPEKLNLGKY